MVSVRDLPFGIPVTPGIPVEVLDNFSWNIPSLLELEKTGRLKLDRKNHTGEKRMVANATDLTLLTSGTTRAQIFHLCKKAVENRCRSVCVISKYVPLAKALLQKTGVRVACVVGFPSGNEATSAKVEEAKSSVRAGATDIDMVANATSVIEAIGSRQKFFEHQYKKDVSLVAKAANGLNPSVCFKVILQTGVLRRAAKELAKDFGDDTVQEYGDMLIRKASELACAAMKEAGIRSDLMFLKTCDGFEPGEATVADVKIMAEVAKKFGGTVKASGNIKDLEKAMSLLKAGASVLGASELPIGAPAIKAPAASSY